MKTNFIIFLLAGWLSSSTAISQPIESNSNQERHFAFEIKNIDEFFERFNFEDDAFILKYLRKNYNGISVDRKSIFFTLLNRHDSNFDKKETDLFLGLLSNSSKPAYLDFYNDNWYAEALCQFEYKGKPTDVTIILKIQQDVMGGSKWMIMAANGKLLPTAKALTKDRTRISSGKFIGCMSYATNFLSLSSALNDRSNIRDYFAGEFFQSPKAEMFLNSLISRQLKFKYVKKVKYHFLQVNGWIFTVDRFERQSINSGWLISSLRQASDTDKMRYKKILFKIDPHAQ